MMYQYLWKYMLLPRPLLTTDGREIKVRHAGLHNRDSGPDFIGARLLIGGEEWAGNVEVHIKASDWYRHHHDSDPAYSNVILHLVAISDRDVEDGRGGTLPQAIARCSDSFLSLYQLLAKKISAVRCENKLGMLNQLTIADWLTTLSIERLQEKTDRVLTTLRSLQFDWEQTCFATLGRALGFGLNSDPLEMLARSIPLRVLYHHADNPVQIDALIFGQAGMLDSGLLIFDRYYQTLCREYTFLAKKYGLRPMRRDLWKYMRTRPQNFPQRRLALLAAQILSRKPLLSSILENRRNPEALLDIMNWEITGYWREHADFDRPADKLPHKLSSSAKHLLLINFVAPVIYAYASTRGDCEMADDAVRLWLDSPAEKNSIIRQWEEAGIKSQSAADSQALLQLRKKYCEADRCLDCRFGHALLRDTLKI